jgi:hypothetical protein
MKKVLNVFVVFAMVAALFTGFAPVQAASAGDLIKVADNNAVYYLGADMTKNVFPDANTYFTWYMDFSGVTTVSSEELNSYDWGKNISFRPGTNLVKITSDPKVYAVEPCGVLRHVPSEAVALDLFGDNWLTLVRDIADSTFLSAYTIGSPLEGDYPTGSLVKEADGTNIYYIDGEEKRPVADMDAFDANMFNLGFVFEHDLSGYTEGASITGEESTLVRLDVVCEEDGPIVPSTEQLSASLSSTTPAANFAAYNADGVIYTTVKLTAGSEAVDVTGMTIKRVGTGEYADIEKVYVEVDGVRHGSKRTFTKETTVNFATTASKITVPANSSIYVNVAADMNNSSTDAGHQNALSVTGITTDATVTGLSVTGNTMTVSSVSAPAVTIDETGTATTIYVGETQVAVSEFTITGSTVEDVKVYSMILENDGTADSDEVINYTIYDESENVVAGPVQATTADKLAFVFDGAITILEDEDASFVIRADVEKGDAKTVILDLDESSDLEVVGENNGFNAAVTDSLDAVVYTIDGGDLTIDEATDNPSKQDKAPEDKDVVFFKGEIKSANGEVMTVKTVTITLYDGSSASTTMNDLENVTLKLDGVTVGGPSDSATASTIVFSDEFEVAGTQYLTLEADLSNDASGNYSARIVSGGVTAEDSERNTATVGGDIVGSTVAVGVGTPTLAKDNTYGNQTVVANDDEVMIGQYILKASDYEGINITRYVVAFSAGQHNIKNLWISEGSVVDSTVTTSSNNFTVSGDDAYLAAGDSRIVKVYADLESSISGTIVTTLDVEGKGETSKDTIVVAATTGQTMTSGSASVKLVASSGTPDAALMLAGKTDNFVGEFTFGDKTNADVGYTITELTVKGVDYDGNLATSVITGLYIKDEDGTRTDLTAINGIATNTVDIYIPKKTEVDVELYADFNIYNNMEMTTTSVQFQVSAYKYILDSSTTEYEITGGSATSTGEVMEIRAAKLSVSAEESSTVLKGGSNDAMEITIVADNVGEKPTVKTLSFEVVTSTDATITGLYLMKGSSITGDLIASDLVASYNTSDVASYEITVPTSNGEISLDDDKVYSLKVVTSGTLADNDYITVKLLGGTNFTWTDGEETTIYGTLVEGLPSGEFTLTK